jgi:very-short-patch-repair endonuclease
MAKRETNIEKLVREELTIRRIEFVMQHPVKWTGFNYYIDFYLPWENLAIECDGDFWHTLKGQIRVDDKKNERLATLGYNIIRLTEEEIIEDVQKAVDKALNSINREDKECL